MSALTPSLSQDGTSTPGNPSPNATPTNGACANGLCECGNFTMTEHLADWSYYAQALVAMWPVKAALAAVATWFSTEPGLLYWLVAMLVVDLSFGLVEAFKRGKFSCRMLKRGGIKFPAYCLCITLVAAVDACMEMAFGVSVPLLEIFLAYLVAQESVSVMGHMVRLGLPVPPIVRRILLHGKHKVEKQLNNILDDKDDEEK